MSGGDGQRKKERQSQGDSLSSAVLEVRLDLIPLRLQPELNEVN